MSASDPVWVQCSAIGCANGIGVHWRHVDNFAGHYYCPEHPETGDAGSHTTLQGEHR